MYFTQQDIVNMEIAKSGPMTQSEIFHELIKEHRSSQHVKEALEGDAYFTVDNEEILSRDFTAYYDSFGVLHNQQTDIKLRDKANNRVPTGFARKHVLEKAAYLAKNEININHPDETTVDNFKEVLGRKFHEVVNKIIEDASNRGKAWLHFFLDGDKFGYMTMHTAWIIPIFETERYEKLIRVIRYYPVETNIAGKTQERFNLEDWNDREVVFYEQTEGGKFVETGRRPHFRFVDSRTGEPIVSNGQPVGGSWGRVPFICIRNNNQAVSDLHFIKRAIDAYDVQISAFCNDLEDIKQAILKFTGTNQDPAVLMDMIRKHGAVALEPALSGEGGQDVDFLRVDTPHEAKDNLLQKLEQIISRTGMALEFDQEKFGDPSGVALKFLYAPLDLKAGLLEIKMKAAFYDWFWFVNRYFQITENDAIPEESINQFEFVFDKFMITNEQEAARLANESQGSLSEQTRLSNDPRVDDVQEELERMEQDKRANMERMQASFEMNGNGELDEEQNT